MGHGSDKLSGQTGEKVKRQILMEHSPTSYPVSSASWPIASNPALKLGENDKKWSFALSSQ